MKVYSIYRIWNKINGKSYIGQSYNPEKRIAEHFRESDRCVALRNAVKKYGKDSFDYEILIDGLSKDEVDDAEREMIVKWNTIVPNGYNLEPGGNANKTLHPDTRKRISESRKKFFRENPDERRIGEKHPMFGLRGKDNPNYGSKRSDETKKKISDKAKHRTYKKGKEHHNYGRKHTAVSRRNMGLSRLGKKRRKRRNPNQLTLFGD